MNWRNLFLMGLTLWASSNVQAQNLVKNGDFEQTNSPFVGGPSNPGGDKKFFANANPSFWSYGPGGGSDYTYLCSPRTADGLVNGGANPFPVYGPFPYSSAGATSDAGGNFAQQDVVPNAVWRGQHDVKHLCGGIGPASLNAVAATPHTLAPSTGGSRLATQM